MALVTRRAAVWVVRRCRMMEHSTVTHDLNAGGGSTPPVLPIRLVIQNYLAFLFWLRRRADDQAVPSAFCLLPGLRFPRCKIIGLKMRQFRLHKPARLTFKDVDSFEAFGRLTWRNPETRPYFAGQRAASLTGFAVFDPEPEVVLITIRARPVE